MNMILKQLLYFQDAAASSQSELVYAYDSDGNEVAMGLIIEGPFDKGNVEMEVSDVIEVSAVDEGVSDSQMLWVGGEEECISTQVIERNASSALKVETAAQVTKQEKKKVKSVVKV